MRGLLLLLLLFISLNLIAQQAHHVYGLDDANYYKRIEKPHKWADTFEIFEVTALKGLNYEQKKKFNGLYYFYDSIGSKHFKQVVLFKRNEAEFRKKFPGGETAYVPYYNAVYHYYDNGKIKQVEITDSSYTTFSDDMPPAIIKYYDTSGNLQAEEKRSFVYGEPELIHKWQSTRYFKNGIAKFNRVALWTENHDEYWRDQYNKNTTEYFDSTTGCKTREVSYLNVRPRVARDFLYTVYWDTVYRVFNNCNTIPDTSFKAVHSNSVFSSGYTEYKGDTI